MRLLRELSRCLLAWNTVGVPARLGVTQSAHAKKNGLHVWTCRPPRNLKVYKSNNLTRILSCAIPHILAISRYSIGYGMNCRAQCGRNWKAEKQGIRSICGRKNPIEGQNSQKPGLGHFAVPAAPRAVTGNLHFAEDLHRVVFRERRLGALPLQIGIVPTFGARKHNSVGFTHTPS